MEFLNKKYSAKNKDLVKQQKREDNINKNKNYGKRIANLHNDYEKKFVVGMKEYAPQQPMKKIEQIYAEINDNKMENLNLDNNDEKNENVGNSDLNKDNGGNDYKQNMESDNLNDEGNEYN